MLNICTPSLGCRFTHMRGKTSHQSLRLRLCLCPWMISKRPEKWKIIPFDIHLALRYLCRNDRKWRRKVPSRIKNVDVTVHGRCPDPLNQGGPRRWFLMISFTLWPFILHHSQRRWSCKQQQSFVGSIANKHVCVCIYVFLHILLWLKLQWCCGSTGEMLLKDYDDDGDTQCL